MTSLLPRHLIDDTRMRRDTDEHWTRCLCGELMTAPSSLDLEQAWLDHRRASGVKPTRSVAECRVRTGKVQPSAYSIHPENRRKG